MSGRLGDGKAGRGTPQYPARRPARVRDSAAHRRGGGESHVLEQSLPAGAGEEVALRVASLVIESRLELEAPRHGGIARGVGLLRGAGHGCAGQIPTDVDLLTLVLVDGQAEGADVLEAGARRLRDDQLAGLRVRSQRGKIVAGVEPDVDELRLLGGDSDGGRVSGDLTTSRLGCAERVMIFL